MRVRQLKLRAPLGSQMSCMPSGYGTLERLWTRYSTNMQAEDRPRMPHGVARPAANSPTMGAMASRKVVRCVKNGDEQSRWVRVVWKCKRVSKAKNSFFISWQSYL